MYLIIIKNGISIWWCSKSMSYFLFFFTLIAISHSITDFILFMKFSHFLYMLLSLFSHHSDHTFQLIFNEKCALGYWNDKTIDAWNLGAWVHESLSTNEDAHALIFSSLSLLSILWVEFSFILNSNAEAGIHVQHFHEKQTDKEFIPNNYKFPFYQKQMQRSTTNH